MKIARVSSSVLLLGTLVLYQNCGQTPQAPNPNDQIVHKIGDSVSAVSAAQFNVRWWAGGLSAIDHRSLDDSNAIDFFNISPGLTRVLALDQNFIVITMNGKLSPNAVLQFNGQSTLAGDYQNLVDTYLKGGGGLSPYQLMVGPSQLSSLKVIVPRAGSFNIRSAREEFVRLAEYNSDNQYCDGALIIQIADPSTLVIDPNTGAATSGVLLEMAVYAVAP